MDVEYNRAKYISTRLRWNSTIMSRTIFRYFAKLFFIAISSILFASVMYAQQQSKYDLLLGIGDFEKCTFSRIAGFDTHGIVPLDNLRIADGWTVRTVEWNPKQGELSLSDLNSHRLTLVNSNTFIADGKEHLKSNKSYQYMSLQYNPEKSGFSHIATMLIPLKYPDQGLIPGAKVVFQVDQIISSNFRSPSPYVAIGITQGGPVNMKQSPVDLSKGYADDASCSYNLVNSNHLWVYIQMRLPKGTATGDAPGILFTGAHLWIQTKDSPQIKMEEEIPYKRNRTINTQKLCYSNAQPARFIAKNYDVVMVNGPHYVDFPAMRKLNPNIKCQLYQTAGAMEGSGPVRWMLGPLKIVDVARDHPDWLYPQSNPPLKSDPIENPYFPDSPYVGKYLNPNGLANSYVISIHNKQFQDEWSRVVIENAKAIGADGIWIDEAGCLDLARDGVQRDTWEAQQFIHAVIPKLRAAGLTSVLMDVLANIDGSRGYRGDYTEVFYNPFWKPTDLLPESAGYTANTPENTPDVFFREYSFMYNDYGYNSEYWLRCINDAKIVAAWNEKLPKQTQKRIYYDVQQEDTEDHPAFNKDEKAGWATFGFASFLLCNNEYVYYGSGFGLKNGNYYGDTKIDYSITKKLGIPDGEDLPIDNNRYFRMRKYKADGEGSFGGVVVVNAEKNKNNTFLLLFDAIDENGKLYLAGTKIAFMPNMGRILINASPGLESLIRISM